MEKIKGFSGQITRGTWVFSSLYNKGLGVVTAVDDNCNKGDCQTIGGVMATGGGNVNVVFECGARSNFSEALLRSGIQYGVVELDDNATEALIDDWLTRSEKAADDAAAAKASKEEAFQAAVNRTRNNPEYAHLTQGANAAKEVAKNIRADLKKHWPSVKFSVRCRSYSCIDISWTDGPTKENVESVSQRYKAGSFNGMEDIYEYSETPFTRVFGSVSYIFETREYSDELLAEAIEKAVERHGNKSNAVLSVDRFRRGELWNVSPYESHCHGEDWQALIHRSAAEIERIPAVKQSTTRQPRAARTASTVNHSGKHPTNDIQQTVHSQKGHDLYVVTLMDRVDMATFKLLVSIAKQFDGYYSKYNRDGAIAGFQFPSLECAQEFCTEIN